jgi:hypothetical protein
MLRHFQNYSSDGSEDTALPCPAIYLREGRETRFLAPHLTNFLQSCNILKKKINIVNHLRIFPLIALLSLASTGCQFLPNSQTPESQPTESNSSTTQPSTNQLPPEQTYELQVNRDQVWGMLRKVAFTDNSIVVTLEVTNGSRQAIELNAKDDMYLKEKGRSDSPQYNLSPPPDNPTIVIQPGTTVTGDFVFIGRLSPTATELTLYTNAKSSYGTAKSPERPYMAFTDIFIRR